MGLWRMGWLEVKQSEEGWLKPKHPVWQRIKVQSQWPNGQVCRNSFEPIKVVGEHGSLSDEAQGELFLTHNNYVPELNRPNSAWWIKSMNLVISPGRRQPLPMGTGGVLFDKVGESSTQNSKLSHDGITGGDDPGEGKSTTGITGVSLEVIEDLNSLLVRYVGPSVERAIQSREWVASVSEDERASIGSFV
ncbi:hypothetical protein F0562_008485 [Nyssa sinensis]|uniref:Uncharacterized protein n=1 Tax=Nyssa sinensis TaxID=561372 RepID=A0A5J5A8U5_9ASTE|nr:hypothetical protein F0562_008485 [Nyssa sinensis]